MLSTPILYLQLLKVHLLVSQSAPSLRITRHRLDTTFRHGFLSTHSHLIYLLKCVPWLRLPDCKQLPDVASAEAFASGHDLLLDFMPSVCLWFGVLINAKHEIVSVLNSLVGGLLADSTLEVGGGARWGFVLLLVVGMIFQRLLIDCQTVGVGSKHMELRLGGHGQGTATWISWFPLLHGSCSTRYQVSIHCSHDVLIIEMISRP